MNRIKNMCIDVNTYTNLAYAKEERSMTEQTWLRYMQQ